MVTTIRYNYNTVKLTNGYCKHEVWGVRTLGYLRVRILGEEPTLADVEQPPPGDVLRPLPAPRHPHSTFNSYIPTPLAHTIFTVTNEGDTYVTPSIYISFLTSHYKFDPFTHYCVDISRSSKKTVCYVVFQLI